jgi:uncharacterized membrane protein
MTTTDQLVDDYLDQLEQELRDVPRARRRELVDEIAQHIADGGAHSEAELRTLLDRLGEPADIADEARERFGITPRSDTGYPWFETVALILLLPGSFVPFGWIAGVVMLWMSRRWTRGDKLIGTFVVPGGVGWVAVALAFGESLSAWLVALLVLPPLGSAIYLAWRVTKA